ncbi:AfsR/SARP family transcriptional regulator [Kitasatospora sp. NPDC018619]|uniref:AfsR/SARP family transcriptional regulator n=1 Tax=unclassified Kitasatospora TaxID=2633591 RepID=UPI0037AA32B7
MRRSSPRGEEGMGVEGRVLGVINLEVPGAKRIFGTTKPAALFGLLVTSPDCRCSLSEVFGHLWPGQEFDRQLVDRAMSDLRRVLGEECVPRTSSGYCILRVPRQSVDYLRFLEALQRSERLPWPEQVEVLTGALAEFPEEEPLKGLPGQGFATRRLKLHEVRLTAVRRQLEAAWHAQDGKLLSSEAERWYQRLPDEAWPLRYYLLARGPEMPRTELEEIVKRWKDRFGSPDAALQRIIGWIRGDTPSPSATALMPVPNQLPAPGRRALGREALIRSMVEFVRERQTAGRGTVIVISGMAGIGKTTVALQLAQRLRDRFPDGTLYAELRGFAGDDTPPVDPEHVLDRFLPELPPYSSVVGPDEKATALRSALARRSVLIVLDDARDGRQVLPLLPGVGTSTVIITSRSSLRDLRAKHDVRLCSVERLDDEAAMTLLQERVAPQNRATCAQAFDDLVKSCAGHPLALTVIAGRLEGRPLRAIVALAKELKEEQKRLDVLDDPQGELSVETALNLSVRALSAEARRLLWQLAIHPGPSIGWDAVMDLGLAGEAIRADRAVEELVAANLAELRVDRYRLHDLVRNFAHYRVQPVDSDLCRGFEEATVRQILEHQLQNVRACDQFLDRGRTLPVGRPDEVTVVEPESLDQAMGFLDAEYETVRSCIGLAATRGMARYIWLLPMALMTYQWRRHHLTAALDGLVAAREVVEETGEATLVDRAMVYRMLAGTNWRRSEYDLAAAQLRRAVLLSSQDDSEAGRLSLARSLHALALTLRKQQHWEEAEEHHRTALGLYRELADAVGEAAALNGLGTIHLDRGELAEALAVCRDARRVAEGTADEGGLADVLYTLAKIHLARRERRLAIPLFQEAGEMYRRQEHWPNEEKVLSIYADVLVAAGRREEAVAVLERVVMLREYMGGAGVQEARRRMEPLR